MLFVAEETTMLHLSNPRGGGGGNRSVLKFRWEEMTAMSCRPSIKFCYFFLL